MCVCVCLSIYTYKVSLSTGFWPSGFGCSVERLGRGVS